MPMTLTSPSDGSPAVDRPVAFVWEEMVGAESYQIQVATDDGFATPSIDVSPLLPTYAGVTSLAALTTYYWRVRAVGAALTTDSGDSLVTDDGTYLGADLSDWSDTWSFTTSDVAVPALVWSAIGEVVDWSSLGECFDPDPVAWTPPGVEIDTPDLYYPRTNAYAVTISDEIGEVLN